MTFLAFRKRERGISGGERGSVQGTGPTAAWRSRCCLCPSALPITHRTGGLWCDCSGSGHPFRKAGTHMCLSACWGGSRVDWRARVLLARDANCFSSWWDTNELFCSSVSSCWSVIVCWAGGDAALTSVFQPRLGAVPG